MLKSLDPNELKFLIEWSQIMHAHLKVIMVSINKETKLFLNSAY